MTAYVNLATSLAWLAVPLTAYFAVIRPVVRERLDRDRVDWDAVKSCDDLHCSLRNHLK